MKKGAARSRTPITDKYRTIYIRRPQHPHIIKWVDPEFEVIYINMDAAPDAKVVAWL